MNATQRAPNQTEVADGTDDEIVGDFTILPFDVRRRAVLGSGASNLGQVDEVKSGSNPIQSLQICRIAGFAGDGLVPRSSFFRDRVETIPGVGVAGLTQNPLITGILPESELQNACILL